MFKNKVYLSIGSNIGDKESNIASSIAILGSYIEISKIKSSSFYKTEPLYNENQPSFLNIVIELETTFTAFQLLDKIREIEKMLGREEIRQKRELHNKLNDINIMKEQIQQLMVLRDEFQEIKQLLQIHIQRDSQWPV